MPLIKNSNLPTFQRLADEGRQILDATRAKKQDIRELHIGFLNIMPDAAFEATERQFFRLVGESNRVVQIHMHPFTLPLFKRSANIQNHLKQYYEPIEKIMEDGLDALIITGANEETNPPVSDESFWSPLKDILNWSMNNVTSTLCSCLSSHVALKYLYGQSPVWQTNKRWGVYRHRLIDKTHPMMRGMNTVFDLPHSRYSEVTREQFEKAGMKILVESAQAGVHMASSPDGLRLICFQGHPEYDIFSLLKEYRRETINFIEGRRPDYPPIPDHYFNDTATQIAEDHKHIILSGKTNATFPEEAIEAELDNTWADSARSCVGSWIGLVYQITHLDRKKPFMDGIDPQNPLGIL